MDDLTATQLRRALRAARELADVRDLAEYPASVSRVLRKLIPCVHAGYNAIDLRSGRAIVVTDPPDAVFDGGPELLAEFGHQSPVVVRGAAGAKAVLRLSDFINRRQLHSTDLYHHVYRPAGLEYQLAVALPGAGGPSELVGISLARTHRDFGEGDRALLGAVLPLLASTLRRLQELAVLQARAAAGPEREDAPMILVDALSVIAWADTSAESHLGLAPGARVPPPLGQWLYAVRGGFGPPPIIILGGEPVRPRLIRDAHGGLDAVRLARASAGPDAGALRGLGLTRRQADVLALLVQGQTSPEIAAVLGLSPRTVEKHIDGMYTRLGVRNRSEAVATAMRHLAS